ncbi:MAG: hypothetical protein KC645_03010 [Gemmatimonadetes bacterium]|nr:hypothetical protein [Gemmatimonadota bacterium]
MIRRRLLAPTRAVLLLAVLLPACTEGGPAPEDSDPVVLLGGRGSEEHVLPERLVVPGGARVRFTTVDRRVHTIRFLLDELPEPARRFLEETGQDASPPLLERGTVFEVWFRDAPRGFYPYLAEGHGAPVRGVIVVE